MDYSVAIAASCLLLLLLLSLLPRRSFLICGYKFLMDNGPFPTCVLRDYAHNVGGWAVEWEGYDKSTRPGWLNPAIYLLIASCYSYELEVQRTQKAALRRARWERVGAGALLGWLDGCVARVRTVLYAA